MSQSNDIANFGPVPLTKHHLKCLETPFFIATQCYHRMCICIGNCIALSSVFLGPLANTAAFFALNIYAESGGDKGQLQIHHLDLIY